MKIKVDKTGEIIEITTPYLDVKDGHLYNHNTGRFEAVGGDIVHVPERQIWRNDLNDFITLPERNLEVLAGQHTDFQFIPCREDEPHCAVLSADDARNRISITHNSTVTLIER